NVLPSPKGAAQCVQDIDPPERCSHTYAAPDDVPQLDHEEIADADFVTITIGGNDMLFGEILKRCWQETNGRVAKPFENSPDPQLAAITYGDYLPTLLPKVQQQVASIVSALKQKTPGVDVLVLGYP